MKFYKGFLEVLLMILASLALYSLIFYGGFTVGRWGGNGEGYEQCVSDTVFPTKGQVEALHDVLFHKEATQ